MRSVETYISSPDAILSSWAKTATDPSHGKGIGIIRSHRIDRSRDPQNEHCFEADPGIP